jgi:hypothetical protein
MREFKMQNAECRMQNNSLSSVPSVFSVVGKEA